MFAFYAERLTNPRASATIRRMNDRFPDVSPDPAIAQCMSPQEPADTARFRAVWDVATDAMVLSDPGGIVLDANPAYYHLYGYGADEVLGRSFAVIFPVEMRSWAEEQYRVTFAQAELAPAVEAPIQRKDGTDGWVESRFTFLTDDTGHRTAMLSVIRDLTQRKRAEREREQLIDQLSAAEAYYRSVFEGVQECILVVDEHDHYLDANLAAEELLGYSRSELLRLRTADVMPAVSSGGMTPYEHCRAAGSWHGETEMRRKDGALLPIEGQAVAIEAPEGQRYVIVARDISARRSLERQRHDFLAMISHDLKNPLTSISGMAQLMLRRGVFSSGTINSILDHARRQERMIDDLLDLAQLGAEQMEIEHEVVDLGGLVDGAIEEASLLAPEHVIEVTKPNEAVLVRGDSDRLRQVLENLLSNAIKYSLAGSTVHVRLQQVGDEGRVEVHDQGPGIPAAVLPHVFDRFFRSDAARHGDTAGLGLGLAICKGIVEAHGGQIGAVSTVGHGSTFWFTIPRA